MKTEPIGSIPRPPSLIEAIAEFQAGTRSRAELDDAYASALGDTIRRLEETGSPVITDGEQTKSSFATYPLSGLNNLAADGVVIPFADGHTRQLPRLTAGPFRYAVHAGEFTRTARSYTKLSVKQAVISAVRAEFDLPVGGDSRISAGGFPGRPHQRGGDRHSRSLRGWGGFCADRLHRGAAVTEAGSVGRAAAQLRCVEQPGS